MCKSLFSLNNGFTLLEVSIAIFILTTGILGSFLLVQGTLSSSATLPSRLVAAHLAQEGVEIVRNIRDTNWVEGASSWDEGLDEGDYEIDYNDTDLPSLLSCSPSCGFNDLSFLYIDNGFYQYSGSGEKTNFKRKITISDKEDLDGDDKPDRLKVSVKVYWEIKGEPYEAVVTEENLYRWH